MSNDIMVALQIYGIGFIIATVIAGVIKGLTVALRKFSANGKQ